MKYTITLRHMSMNDKLSNHIEKRFNLLERHIGATSAHLTLEQPRCHAQQYSVKSVVSNKGQTVFGKCTDACIYTAVNKLEKKLEKQFHPRRKVNSAKARHHNSGFMAAHDVQSKACQRGV